MRGLSKSHRREQHLLDQDFEKSLYIRNQARVVYHLNVLFKQSNKFLILSWAHINGHMEKYFAHSAQCT
jgi:hypothetical protein